jgi:hypothetical protein
MTSLPARRRLAVLALVLLVAGLVSACGGSDDGVEIEMGNGGADVTIAGDGVTIGVDQGDGVQLPDSWPASVPTPDGAPTMATSGEVDGTQGWTVNYSQADAEAFDAYVEALRAAGGESQVSMDQAGLRSETFTIGEYGVTVQLMDGIGMTIIIGPGA